MAGLSTVGESVMLQYLLLGATATFFAGPGRGIGLSLGSPSTASASEIASGTGVVRLVNSFSSQAINTFTNVNAATYGPVNAVGSYSGINVFVTTAASYTADQGTYLAGNTLATIRSVGSGDSLVLAAGALSISLA